MPNKVACVFFSLILAFGMTPVSAFAQPAQGGDDQGLQQVQDVQLTADQAAMTTDQTPASGLGDTTAGSLPAAESVTAPSEPDMSVANANAPSLESGPLRGPDPSNNIYKDLVCNSTTIPAGMPTKDADGKDVVYLSISNDGKYLASDGTISGVPMANLAIPIDEAAKINLADYGLERYNYDADDDGVYETTVLKLLVYALENYCSLGVTGVNDDGRAGLVAADQALGSFFMTNFWGHDCNFTYYTNVEYPLQYTGWGATADCIILRPGLHIDLAMLTSWGFFSDSNAGHVYFYNTSMDIARESATVQYQATAGVPLTMGVMRAGSNMGAGSGGADGDTSTAYNAVDDQPVYVAENYGSDEVEMIGFTSSDGTVSYTFETPGLYYVWTDGLEGIDTDAGNVVAGPALAQVKVLPAAGEQEAPKLADGVSATATASVDLGASYSVSLGSIFMDPNGDPLTYKVSIDGAEAVAADASYTYTPAAAGTTTLVFTANDGTADSTDTYTVTLTVAEAAAGPVAIYNATDNVKLELTTVVGFDPEYCVEHNVYPTFMAELPRGKDVKIVMDPTLMPVDKWDSINPYTPTNGAGWIPSFDTRGADGSYQASASDLAEYTYRASEFATEFAGEYGYYAPYPGSQSDDIVVLWVANVLPEATQAYFDAYDNGNGWEGGGGYTHIYLKIVDPSAPANNAPVLADGVAATASALLDEGATYELDLTKVFADADNDPLTYAVAIDGADPVAAPASYSYEGAKGKHMLVFTANDGTATSTDTYTVDLTVGDVFDGDIIVYNTTDGTKLDVTRMYGWPRNESDVENDRQAVYKVTIPTAKDLVVKENPSTMMLDSYYTKHDREVDRVDNASDPYDGTVVFKGSKNALQYTVSAADLRGRTHPASFYTGMDTWRWSGSSSANIIPLMVVGATTPACDELGGQSFYWLAVEIQDDSNKAPTLAEGVAATAAATVELDEAYALDLTTVFTDADNDSLTYKVKVNGAEAVAADASYTYTPAVAGTTTLVFTANDGIGDSTDTYTVTLTASAPVYAIDTDTTTTRITAGDTAQVVFKCNAPFELFTGFVFDGALLTQGTDYTAASGSTVVTLSDAFASSIEAGDHTWAMNFSNGAQVTGTLTADAAPEGTDPTDLWSGSGWSSTFSSNINLVRAQDVLVKSFEWDGTTCNVVLAPSTKREQSFSLYITRGSDGGVRINGTQNTATAITYPMELSNGQASVTLQPYWMSNNGTLKTFNFTVEGGGQETLWNVDLGSGTGYTVSPVGESASPVANKGSYTFKVDIADGYKKGADFAVKVNGEAVTLDANGQCTISNIVKDQVVTVEDVVTSDTVNQYRVTLTEADGVTYTPVNDSASPVAEGNSYSFTISLATGYVGGTVNDNGTPMTADENGVYTISAIAAHHTVTVTGVVHLASVTAPTGSTVAAGSLSGSFAYTWADPAVTADNGDGTTTYYFNPIGGTTFFRVQHPEGVTYWNFEDIAAGRAYAVTMSDLTKNDSLTSKTVYHDFYYNYLDLADVYLTINAQNYLPLAPGGERIFSAFRNWQAIESFTNAKIAIPDVHYEVVDINGNPSDLVTVVPDAHNTGYATIKAADSGSGMAIIKVTYDAMIHMDGYPSGYGAGGADVTRFSAIWPECTGIIVVTVGQDGSGINLGMTINTDGPIAHAGKVAGDNIDAEHDLLYYYGNEGASYTFKPAAGTTVSIARCTLGTNDLSFNGFTTDGVTTDDEGNVTVTGLTAGRHIVKVEKDGLANYQVISARQITVTVKDSDGNVVEDWENHVFIPGDTLTYVLHNVNSPQEKLATCYNNSFTVAYFGEGAPTTRLANSSNGAEHGYGQYNFSSLDNTITVPIPADWTAKKTYTITDGAVAMGGFSGTAAGGHRGKSYGVAQGMATGTGGAGVLAKLPDITVNVDAKPYVIEGLTNPVTASANVGEAYELDLSKVFADGNGDALTYTVAIDDAAPVAAAETYSVTFDEPGKYTLVFTANDGIVDSTGTYTVVLKVGQDNVAPTLKDSVEPTATATIASNEAYSVNLNSFFEDADGDFLTYKVSVNGSADRDAFAAYSYNPPKAGTFTLVFTANDGTVDSQDTYTVTLTVSEGFDPATYWNNAVDGNGWVGRGERYCYVQTVSTSGALVQDFAWTNATTCDIALAPSTAADATFDFTVTNYQRSSGTNGVRINGTTYNGATRTVPITLVDGKATVTVQPYGYNTTNASYQGTTKSFNFSVGETSNAAPVLAEGVEATAEATIGTGYAYEVDLKGIFADPDDDQLAYTVSVNGADPVAAAAAYTFTTDTAGTVTLSFVANDGTADSPAYTVTLTVEKATFAFDGTELAAGKVGAAYEDVIKFKYATGKPSVYVVGGFEIPGLAIDGTGAVAGTPTKAGTYTFRAIASDDVANTQIETFTLKVDDDIAITTESLANGVAGEAYAATLAATSTDDVAWALAEGSVLPAGLTLSEDGTISGAPEAAGTATFTVTATTAAGTSAEKELSITVKDRYAQLSGTIYLSVSDKGAWAEGTDTAATTLAYVPIDLANVSKVDMAEFEDGLVSAPADASYLYEVTLAQVIVYADGTYGGLLDYEGDLLLTLNGAAAEETAAIANGDFVDIAKYVDKDAFGGNLYFTSDGAIVHEFAPVATGTAINSALVATNGVGEAAGYANTVVKWGTTLGTAAGQTTTGANGSFSIVANEAGTYYAWAENAAAEMLPAYATFTVFGEDVPAAPTITTATLPSGVVGDAYEAKVEAFGTPSEITYAVLAGGLPDGLTMAENGTISGTPTKAGTYNVTVRAINEAGMSSPVTLELVVEEYARLSSLIAHLTTGQPTDANVLLHTEGDGLTAGEVFSPTVYEYTLATQPDSGNQVRFRPVVSMDGAKAMLYYGPNFASSKDITWKSGSSTWANFLSLTDGVVEAKIVVTPPAGSDANETTYLLRIPTTPQLTALSATADGTPMYLDKTFNANTAEYTLTIPASAETVEVAATPRRATYKLTYNGVESNVVNVAGIDKIEVGIIAGEGANATTNTYTVNLNKVASGTATFNVTPADAIVNVFDAKGAKLRPNADGSFTGMFSESDYTYTVAVAGYKAQTGIIPAAGGAIDVTLEAVPESTVTKLDAFWPLFRQTDNNMAIVDIATPNDPAQTELKWAARLGTGYANAPGMQLIVDNTLIVCGNKAIYKLDLQTGEILASGTLAASGNWGYTPLTYVDGVVYVPISGGIQAINAETLESMWVYKDKLGGQALSEMVVSNGYIYAGYWNSETKDANFACVSIADEDPTQTDEAKVATWTHAHAGGFYWAGGVAVGDYIIVGSDDGTSGTEGDSVLYAFNGKTGEIASSIVMEGFGDQRSSMAWDASRSRVYFTSKGGNVASAAFDATTGQLSDLKWSSTGWQCTGTPIVYDGVVYVGFGAGFGAGSGRFGAFDATTMEKLYEKNLQGYPQASLLLSTAYVDSGYLYFYSTYNTTPGGLQMVKVAVGGRTADDAEVFDIYDAAGYSQYCICTPICGPDGTIYYKNDSGNILAVGWTDIAPTITTESLEAAVVDTSYEATLAATGRPAEFTWALAEGSALPEGLTLSEAGVISGTPTASGTYSFTAVATNRGGSAEKEFTLVVQKPLEIATEFVPAIFVGQSDYAFQFEAEGVGSDTAVWSLETSSTGNQYLSLSEDGLLTTKSARTGTASIAPNYFKVTATAADGTSVSKSFRVAWKNKYQPVTGTYYITFSEDGEFVTSDGAESGTVLWHAPITNAQVRAADLDAAGLGMFKSAPAVDANGNSALSSTNTQSYVYPVNALNVLVAAAQRYGGDTEVAVNAGGWITKAFGMTGDTKFTFLVNGKYPYQTGSTTVGAMINEVPVTGSISLELAHFTDEYWNTEFNNGIKTFVNASGAVEFNRTGIFAGDETDFQLQLTGIDWTVGGGTAGTVWPAPDYVDKDGIEVAYGKAYGEKVGSVETDEDGIATITFPETEGATGAVTWYVWAAGDEGAFGLADVANSPAMVTAQVTNKQAPAITTASIANQRINSAMNVTLQASGQPKTFTWSLGEGSTLPEGITLTEAGKLTGMPTEKGEFTFTVIASNGVGEPAAKEFTFTVGDKYKQLEGTAYLTLCYLDKFDVSTANGAEKTAGIPIAYLPVDLAEASQFDAEAHGMPSGANGSVNSEGTYDLTAVRLIGYVAYKYYDAENPAAAIQGTSYVTGTWGHNTGNIIYEVDGVSPMVGIGDWKVKDGEVVSIYNCTNWSAWGDPYYGFHYFLSEPNLNGFDSSKITYRYTGAVDEPVSVYFSREAGGVMSSSDANDAAGYTLYYGRTYGDPAGSVVCDENGTAQITFDQPGEWMVWADGGRGMNLDDFVSSAAIAWVSVAGAPVVSTATLDDAVAYTDYEAQLEALTTSAVTWFVEDSSAVPAGLKVATDGKVSGTPTTPGEYTFKVFAVNNEGMSDTVEVKITVLGDAPAITTATLPAGEKGAEYAASIEVAGLPAPAVEVSGLPEGMAFDAESLAITGTPTASGEFTVTVTATNGLGTATAELALVVNETPRVVTETIDAGNATVAFEGTIELSGYPAPQVFISGEVPGLTFASDGIVSGTPTEAGTFTIHAVAKNSFGSSAMADITVTVAPVDRSALEAAITAAEAAAADEDLKTSADGTDVWSDDEYVTPDARETLADAITAAKAVLADDAATQAEVAAAAAALTQAAQAFEDSATAGTKGVTALYPVNEELMFKFVNAKVVAHADGTAELVFSLSGTGYKYVYNADVDTALANTDAIAAAYAGNATSGDLVWGVSVRVDQNYATDRPADNPPYQEHADGVAAKLTFTLPLSGDALAAVTAGTGSVKLPLVSVSDSRAKKAIAGTGQWADALLARQAILDMDAKTLRTGNLKDTLAVTVTSSIETMPVAASGELYTFGTPAANEYVVQPTFKLSDGKATYDAAFAGTAAAAAAASASATVAVGEDGTVVLPFKNTLGKPSQVVDGKATAAFRVADGAPFFEAGTWVEREFTFDTSTGAVAISGAELSAKPADGTYAIADLASSLGMPGIPNGKDLLAPTMVVKDGKATLVFATSTYRFDQLAFGTTDQISEDGLSLAEGAEPVVGSPIWADELVGDATKDVKGYVFAMPLTDEQLAAWMTDNSVQMPYLLKYIADPDDVIKNHDNDWYKASNQPKLTIGAAERISDATALPEASADYAGVITAIKSVPADLSLYTDESVAALQAALTAVDTSKKATDQAAVDAMAQAISDAVAALAVDEDKAAAKAVEDAIAALPAPEDVTTADEAAINAAAAALDALIDAQEALVSDEAKAKLAADQAALEAARQATIKRIAGESYANETAAAISAESFASSEWVVIARDDDFADALGAVGLAGALNAPILLTDRFGLSDAAAAEIGRLGATKAYVIGGTGAIKEQVDSDLASIGVTVEPRIWGEYSWDTSVACAKAIEEVTGKPADTAIAAMSINFQDALSMSSYAYKYQVPVVLQTWGDTAADRTFSDEGAAFLAGKSVIVAGGPGAISDDSLSGLTFERIYGETGYDTSEKIAEYMVDKGLLGSDAVVIACGAQAPKGVDALAGAALAGKLGAPMLLVNSNEEMEAADVTTVEGFVTAHKADIKSAYVLGGTYVVPQDLYDSIKSLLDAEDLSA